MQHRVSIDWCDPAPGTPSRFTIELETHVVRELVLASLDTASRITIEPMPARIPAGETSTAAGFSRRQRRVHGGGVGAVDDDRVQAASAGTEGAEQAALEVALDVSAEEAVRSGIGHESFVAMARAAYRQARQAYR
jgi:hypothetical protein